MPIRLVARQPRRMRWAFSYVSLTDFRRLTFKPRQDFAALGPVDPAGREEEK